ncbi:MAG TPA: 5-oxoprolinase subunit PxpA [Acidimicrobiales bacterium]|nr:5-oxoprolinase subunit PxpA [Acidimicrobiales bacterium]
MNGAVDLNADLGEGFGAWRMGDDAALLEVVTSANVACGYHAGDAGTMARTCALAAERAVAIGAHVAYRDLAGFGRRAIDVPAAQVRDEVLHQIGGLAAFAAAAGSRVAYVKPHGALYHRACADGEVAAAVVDAAVAASGMAGAGPMAVLSLPGSALGAAARAAGLVEVAEGYLDRGYTPVGALVPRGAPGDVLHDPDEIAARAVDLAAGRPVAAVGGGHVRLAVRSLCTHGDEPAAVEAARRSRAALEAAGVTVAAFA